MTKKNRWLITFTLLLTTLTWGCKDESKEYIPRARRALMQGNLDEAEKQFEAARKANPDSYPAQWGVAQVLGKRGNFEAQAKQLRDMLSKKDFEAQKPLLDEELEKALLALASAAEKDDDREKFLREAIEVNKASEANAKLAAILTKKAGKAMGKGQNEEARKLYEEVSKLRISKKERRSAKAQAELLGFLAFKAKFKADFEKVKASFVEAGEYDEPNQQFTVLMELESVGDPKAEDFESLNQRNAIAYAAEGLAKLAFKVAGAEMPEGAQVKFSASDVSILEQGFTDPKKREMYKIKVAVPEDAIIGKIEDLRAGKFEIKKPEPPAADGGVPAPEENKGDK